jgi:hypothetical protein
VLVAFIILNDNPVLVCWYGTKKEKRGKRLVGTQILNFKDARQQGVV